MKILIAEDDLTSRLFMKKYLSQYGECQVAVNGVEAIDRALEAMESGNAFDLICMDIMMPKVDGIKALKMIRQAEQSKNTDVGKTSKVIMTTALNDKNTVAEAYASGCEAYAWKPIEIEKFNDLLRELELID